MPKTPKNPLVYKEKSNNNVSKKVPVKSNDVSDVSDVSKEVTFEETPEGYPIGRTESGTGIYQSPELLEERKKMKGTHFVLNPTIKPKQAKYPINPKNFWTRSDIRNAKKEVKKEAELRRQAEAKLRRQIEEENCSDDSYSNDSDDSYFDDSYSKNSYSKNSNTKNSNCTISGGRSQKRRQRSQKIRRRNKKTRRHRKK